MQLGFIGAGRVGCSMGKYLSNAGITVTGYYSKTGESAKEAAAFTNSKAFLTLDDLCNASNTLCIAVPDDEIGKVWDCIAKDQIQDKIICHFSGSLSSVVFSGIENYGAMACSIHPMYAFSDKFHSYEQLHTAAMTMEGNKEAVSRFRMIFEHLGNRVYELAPKDKIRYHAAAALSSNNVNGLLWMAIQELVTCGFSEEEAKDILYPVFENNVKNILKTDPVSALTGPVERGDIQTVTKHLATLEGATKQAYVGIGKTLTKMATIKYPNRELGISKCTWEE